jgi:hypothetical protein
MAHESWNAIDNFTQKFDNVYCAFLDILGYKSKSEEFFQNKYNLLGRVERALELTQQTIEISSIFVDISGVEITFFSDSIILTAPKKENNLYCILHFSRILSAYLSYEGLFIRGGISEGKHLETKSKIGSSFLASKALQNAYLLEFKYAKNPRVLIDPSLIGNLTIEEKELIFIEYNDYVLDFAPMIINREGSNENDVFLEMEDILRCINDTNDLKVRNKYRWLLDYYYWTIVKNNKFEIKRFNKFKSRNKRNFMKLQ